MSNISFVKRLPIPVDLVTERLAAGAEVDMVVEVELKDGGFGISRASYYGPRSVDVNYFYAGGGHRWEQLAEDYLVSQFAG